jgi:hypothetical protein
MFPLIDFFCAFFVFRLSVGILLQIGSALLLNQSDGEERRREKNVYNFL